MYTQKTAYLIPSDDPHLSEYVPSAYMRRGYLTDFHGSAGTALVLTSETIGSVADTLTTNMDGYEDEGKGAYLWTDSRFVSVCLQLHCLLCFCR